MPIELSSAKSVRTGQASTMDPPAPEDSRVLGPAEQVMWHIGESGCNQIALTISGQGPLSTERLGRSLQMIALKHPIITCKMDLSSDPPRLVCDRHRRIDFEEVVVPEPFSFAAIIENEVNRKTDLTRGVCRVRLFFGPDEKWGMILVAPHLMIDGRSFQILFEDLWRSYAASSGEAALSDSEPQAAALPPAIESRLLHEQRGFRGSYRFVAYLLRQALLLSRRPTRLFAKGTLHRIARKSRVLTIAIDEDVSAAFFHAVRRYGQSIHSCLCIALLESCRRVCGVSGDQLLGCLSPVDLRPMLAPAASEVGFFASGRTTPVFFSARTGFWDLCAQHRDSLKRSIEHGDVFSALKLCPLLIRGRAGNAAISTRVDRAHWASCVASNMGELRLPEMDDCLVQSRNAALPGIENVFIAATCNSWPTSGINMTVLTWKGRLHFCFFYGEGNLDDGAAADIVTRFREIIATISRES